jgi:predicted glycosyltransferase
MRAFKKFGVDSSARLFVYTGPYIDAQDFAYLQSLANQKIKVEKFTSDFLAYLAAADLSISMGGYNTSMNLLACGVRALVWPFGFNREQRLRAQRLAERGAFKILKEQDLQHDRLARIIMQTLSEMHPGKLDINLEGAANTARWLEDWYVERNIHHN